MSGISLERVTKRFGAVVAVDDFSLDIHDQEFLVLLGPSGCGKSTVLRVIAGLDDPTRGVVRIGGRIVNHVEPKDRDLAMVFQSYALYPQMTVRKNIEFPLRTRHVPADERARIVAETAEMLGLSALMDRKPGALSGGQRQRVALARAIVRRPAAFLMDEPLSNLDAKLRVQTRAELIELQRDLHTTVVYVTHDQVEAMTMGHRIAIMTEGALQQVAPPQEIYDRPANMFVGGFIGTPPMNMLAGDVRRNGEGVGLALPGAVVPLPPALARAVTSADLEQMVIGVRPEHLQLLPDGDLPAVVTVIESLGAERHIVGRVAGEGAGQMVIARQLSDEPTPAVGESVRLSTSIEHLHAFDPVSGARIEGLP
jgi:multiple sugar transport system ATP-binding protein